MTMMLAPDLLDRRALARLVLRDSFGRTVRSPVLVTGEGVRTLVKADGTIAVLDAPGFAAHAAAFAAPPATPATGSRSIGLAIMPAEPRLQGRRFVLKLPRDADPANAAQADSLFRPVEITLLASPLQRREALACVVRVTVRRKSDGALVGNALVRARSDSGQFEAMAVTDRLGEAALVFANLPVAFPGAGATADAALAAKAIVKVVPAKAVFTPAETASAGGVSSRDAGIVDPDDLAGGAAPSFAGGTPFKLSAGTEPALALEWKQP